MKTRASVEIGPCYSLRTTLYLNVQPQSDQNISHNFEFGANCRRGPRNRGLGYASPPCPGQPPRVGRQRLNRHKRGFASRKAGFQLRLSPLGFQTTCRRWGLESPPPMAGMIVASACQPRTRQDGAARCTQSASGLPNAASGRLSAGRVPDVRPQPSAAPGPCRRPGGATLVGSPGRRDVQSYGRT